MEKGGLWPPFCLYLYFTKWDGLTTPGFDIFYRVRNEDLGPENPGFRG
jgi:hypothetical protein